MTPTASLAPSELEHAVTWLREALDSPVDPSTPSPLADADRMDSIRALEQLVCVATAAQAQLAADLDRSQSQARESAGVRRERRSAGTGSQIAFARRESPHRGQRHLALAKVVTTELPHTWQAWRHGHITEWTATVIARETACLALPERLEVDRIVAHDSDVLEQWSERELIARLRAEAERLDPASVVARRRKAESERHVSLRAAPDTMTWLTALLPVKDGVAAYAALIAAADTARSDGDPRTRGQVMADTLTARLTSAPAGELDTAPTHPVQLNLVMTDAALFGHADDGARLEDFGHLPAELAREIVAGALSEDEQVWVRRLFADPETGELISMDSRSRGFTGSLGRFIRLRDGVCRTPWCNAPVRHVDHVEDHADGGETSAINGQGLCEACNYAKQALGWQARASTTGPHEVITTLPTGHRYRSRVPIIATIRSTAAPPLRLDYVLTC